MSLDVEVNAVIKEQVTMIIQEMFGDSDAETLEGFILELINKELDPFLTNLNMRIDDLDNRIDELVKDIKLLERAILNRTEWIDERLGYHSLVNANYRLNDIEHRIECLESSADSEEQPND